MTAARVAKLVTLILALLCAGLAGFDLVYPHHGTVGIDAYPLFYCALGFVAYAALIFMAKGLRRFISRPENYYGREAIDAESGSGPNVEVRHD